MADRPANHGVGVTPAEMESLVARAGLSLNPGQMADLVLIWRQMAALISSLSRERNLACDAAVTFRLAPPPTLGRQAAGRAERRQRAGRRR